MGLITNLLTTVTGLLRALFSHRAGTFWGVAGLFFAVTVFFTGQDTQGGQPVANEPSPVSASETPLIASEKLPRGVTLRGSGVPETFGEFGEVLGPESATDLKVIEDWRYESDFEKRRSSLENSLGDLAKLAESNPELECLIYVLKGDVYLEHGLPADAVNALEKARRLNPRDLLAAHFLREAYRRRLEELVDLLLENDERSPELEPLREKQRKLEEALELMGTKALIAARSDCETLRLRSLRCSDFEPRLELADLREYFVATLPRSAGVVGAPGLASALPLVNPAGTLRDYFAPAAIVEALIAIGGPVEPLGANGGARSRYAEAGGAKVKERGVEDEKAAPPLRPAPSRRATDPVALELGSLGSFDTPSRPVLRHAAAPDRWFGLLGKLGRGIESLLDSVRWAFGIESLPGPAPLCLEPAPVQVGARIGFDPVVDGSEGALASVVNWLAADPTSVGARKRVLSLGVDDYDGARLGDRPLADLNFARADASRVAGRLRQLDFESNVLEPDETSKQDFFEVLDRSIADGSPDDQLVLFLAGHGVTEPDGTPVFLLRSEWGLEPVALPEIASRLERFEGEATVLVDACPDEAALGAARRNLGRSSPKVRVITASDIFEKPFEFDGWGSGMLTHHLLSEINRVDPGGSTVSVW